MEQYAQIITRLKEDLEQMSSAPDQELDTTRKAIRKCQQALVRLRQMVLSRDFPDQQSEIRFFKEMKPFVYGRLLFFQRLFEIQSIRARYAPERMKLYLEARMDEVQHFMEEHAVCVQYHHCGFTYLDSLYFVRYNDQIPVELRNGDYAMDEQFSTWQDHTFAMIQANTQLLEHLNREIGHLENPEQSNQLSKSRPCNWTSKKIYLVELIYSLYFSRVINDGEITIKELAEIFSRVFNVDLQKDVYRNFAEIQQRKIDQTKFIDHLKSVLQQKIDQNIEA